MLFSACHCHSLVARLEVQDTAAEQEKAAARSLEACLGQAQIGHRFA